MEEKTSILVVDDDLGMSETLSDILGEMGYNIAVANDGYKAIEMVSKYAYNIVLMDIKMPGLSGVETYKKVKYIRPSMKVIMMTAYSVESLVEEALKEGAYGVIYKPLNINKLLQFIRKIEKGVFILIVDDDHNFCKTFRDGLKELKYKVTVKYSGKQAIKYIKENDVDITFIDVKMPVLNGLDIYLAIKKINPKISGIMITGYQYEEKIRYLIEEAFKKNLYACLYKPLETEKVVALVEEISRKKLKFKESPTS